MDFSSILHVFTALNKHDVQSMAVGGTAVAFYGHYRLSTNRVGEIVEKPDIDIWYNPTYQNYYNLLKVCCPKKSGRLGKHSCFSSYFPM